MLIPDWLAAAKDRGMCPVLIIFLSFFLFYWVSLELFLICGSWCWGRLEGLPCEFEGIMPSPVVDGYRNKCEFAIGLGPDGKQRVVGFQLGSFRSDLLTSYCALVHAGY